ncbi:coiled-coil domain-containing protein 42 homolog [Anableps anableps]
MFSRMTGNGAVSSRRSVRKSMTGRDFITAQIDLKQKERELEQLRKKFQEQKQYLVYLHQRKSELQQTTKETREQRFKLEMFFRDEETEDDRIMAEKEMKEAMEKEAEVQRLKEECLELKKGTKEMQLQTIKYSHYKAFFELVLKLTKFDDVDALAGYFESLLHIRDQLYQRETQVQEQMEQQKKSLQILKDQHNLLWLQKNNQLSQLQTELEKTRSEALIWDRQWNQIQETSAKKMLELGQITYATLNLYELAGGVIGPEGLDINDTEKQLEEIKLFILDHADIVKQYQTYLQRVAKENKQEPTETILPYKEWWALVGRLMAKDVSGQSWATGTAQGSIPLDLPGASSPGGVSPARCWVPGLPYMAGDGGVAWPVGYCSFALLMTFFCVGCMAALLRGSLQERKESWLQSAHLPTITD